MKVDLSPITPTKDSVMECHIKTEMQAPGLVDSPTGYVMTIDNTSYVTVEGTRFAGDFSTYLRDREKTEFSTHATQDPLYTLSQRFDNPAITYDLQRVGSDEETLRTHKCEHAEAEPQDPRTYEPIRVCVYLMSKVALHLDLEDRNCAAQDLTHAILLQEELGLPRSAASVFTLWMCSGLVELQLKPHHKPFELRLGWREIVSRFSSATESRQRRDEPSLSFQRNVFFPKKEEEKIKDQKILELLYEEARYNVLEGRYPCEPSHYVSLGGIQARIEMGPYNPQVHTIQFFRENHARFLPAHLRRTAWSWLRISGKNSPEVRLAEQYKRIPPSTPTRKLIHKYLEFCRALPYYGGAFFQGQVEQPVRGLTSLITHQDIPVLVAINSQGIYVIDHVQCTLLLGLKYEDMSWDYAKPSQVDNADCLPCLFIQFMVLENGARVSKILQVFSKQAVMMDSLISVFVDQSKRKVGTEEADGVRPAFEGGACAEGEDTHLPLTARRELFMSCLCNKLSKLTLATFDDDGHCIGQMGSWSFSY